VTKDGNVKLLKKIILISLMDSTKDRLRKKLKNKKESRTGKKDASPEKVDEDNLFNMLNQVNQMLKQNPNMVKKVSKCVNSIFENKDLMKSLVSEIESNVKESEDFQDSQTLDNNSVVPEADASTKESVQ
jgi:3-hydroxyacyl-CoA dehydrogenase